MRKQLRLLVLFLVSGCTLFFSSGALSTASPQADYSSDNLGNYVPEPSLVVDFGAMGGLCRYTPASPLIFWSGRWSQLATGSPNHMVSTTSMLIANFPGFGLYEHNGTAWNHITQNDSVENLVAVPREFAPQGYVYADYGSLGIWQYEVDLGNWSQITAANPDKMWACGSNLLANFPGDGLYQYDGTGWTRLTPNSTVENLVCGSGWVYADFGSLGLWKYDGEWHNLSYSNPNMMVAYRGNSVLIANFPGYGLYEYHDDANTWTQLTPNDAVQALVAVADAFYADYGHGTSWGELATGLWKYSSLGWQKIHTIHPNMMASVQDDLIVNFPSD